MQQLLTVVRQLSALCSITASLLNKSLMLRASLLFKLHIFGGMNLSKNSDVLLLVGTVEFVGIFQLWRLNRNLQNSPEKFIKIFWAVNINDNY
jgi:hypothetical protein